MTVKFDGLPGTFTVAEIARRDKVSRREVLRRLRNGVYAGYVRVGNVILVLNQSAADELCRSLPPGDERRQVVDELDEIVRADFAESQRVNAEQEAERHVKQSPEAQAKYWRDKAKEAEAERPRRSKLVLQRLGTRGRSPVSDAEDIEIVADGRIAAKAPPRWAKSGKPAFVLDPNNHGVPDNAHVYTPERIDP